MQQLPLASALGLALSLALLSGGAALGDEAPADELPVVAYDDFRDGLAQWDVLDPDAWKLVQTEDGNTVLSQHVKEKSYRPPHKSPYHVAVMRGPIVGDFVLTARVRSTHPPYNHRDVCVLFGFQDAARFYYAHMGQETDAASNQIHIVNNAERTKITSGEPAGTLWDDEWHTVRVVRRVAEGTIEIYFDDMTTPAKTAKDATFTWGRVGIGTHDDTADWDWVELRGVVPAPPIEHHDVPDMRTKR